ncbi:MAG: hypothetical protein ACLGI2_03515 [Acidimicrobiia bacterium]
MIVVDAANVVGSRPDGWWRDRAGAARGLVVSVRDAARAGRVAAPVVIVLEGEARDGVAEGTEAGVEVVHASAHGDDRIAEVVLAGPGRVVLVSADRGLRARVAGPTVETVGPSWLLDRL